MTQNYNLIDKPHSIVHENVIAALKCLDHSDGCIDTRNKILEDFTNMEKASAILFKLMDEMVDQKYSTINSNP